MEQHKTLQPNPLSARSALLLIDDNVKNLELLARMLEWAGYVNVTSCPSGKAGLEALSTVQPDLVILDLNMPVLDGYEFLRQLRDEIRPKVFLPVLVFTADLTAEARARALELGATDFLTKPGDAIEIQLRVQNFLRMRRMHAELKDQNDALEVKVEQRTEHLVVARQETAEVLADACEYRDDATGQHGRRVGELSAGIALHLGLAPEFISSIRFAAPLHDLGKISTPDAILFKPSKLTEEEFVIMKHHAVLGAQLLEKKSSPLLQLAAEIARFHHERWDGSGYEAGLVGTRIPISARIVSAADTYDVMTNDRPYRVAGSQADAISELQEHSGSQFDPDVVKALLAHLSVDRIGLAKAA